MRCRRLTDVLLAIEAIGEHRTRGPLDDLLVFGAVRMRLDEIGEAVATLSDDDLPVLTAAVERLLASTVE